LHAVALLVIRSISHFSRTDSQNDAVQDRYQSTLLADMKQQIAESLESLGDSNVSAIPFRGNPG
jgi:hypothetical protein